MVDVSEWFQRMMQEAHLVDGAQGPRWTVAVGYGEEDKGAGCVQVWTPQNYNIWPFGKGCAKKLSHWSSQPPTPCQNWCSVDRTTSNTLGKLLGSIYKFQSIRTNMTHTKYFWDLWCILLLKNVVVYKKNRNLKNNLVYKKIHKF